MLLPFSEQVPQFIENGMRTRIGIIVGLARPEGVLVKGDRLRGSAAMDDAPCTYFAAVLPSIPALLALALIVPVS